MLSKKQVIDICSAGLLPQQCRYLDQQSDGKWQCLKLRAVKQDIDEVIIDFIGMIKPNEINNFAMGNNCQGYPVLNNIEQGYDKD